MSEFNSQNCRYYYGDKQCKAVGKCNHLLYSNCVNRLRADSKALKTLLEEAAEELELLNDNNDSTICDLLKRIKEAL